MNENVTGLDNLLSKDYQSKSRLLLQKVMQAKPMSVSAHARSIGIAPNSLSTFLRGAAASYATITRIDNYIADNS